MSFVIPSGKTRRFKYLGDQIPNIVTFRKISGNPLIQGSYTIKSGNDSWEYYGYIGDEGVSNVSVHWPTTVATITNTSKISDIIIEGDGIFPFSN